MIFDGRALDDIADAEIEALVAEHVSERRHLEFKMTIDYRDDGQRREFLRDVASLANAGGGYLIIGIRDDGRGRAQQFANPGDTQRIARALRDLAIEYIEDRIDGLEIRTREVAGNPIVVVRVPVSLRRPHMVTLLRSTDFYTRYEDGKREMTLTEIREAFTRDPMTLRLLRIEESLRQLGGATATRRREELVDRIQADEPFAYLGEEEGRVVADADAHAFVQVVGGRPAFHLAAAPRVLQPEAVDLRRDEVRAPLLRAPHTRENGWIVTNASARLEEVSGVLRERGVGAEHREGLALVSNGYLRYARVLDGTFYWGQSVEESQRQPRIWSLAVIEYPLTFLRLFRRLCDICTLPAPYYFRLELANIRGHALVPTPAYYEQLGVRVELEGIARDRIVVVRELEQSFGPDQVSFDIAREIYEVFDFGDEYIPFWDAERLRFRFPGDVRETA